MRRLICLLGALAMFLAGPVLASQKHALLIGITNYGYFYQDVPEQSRLFPDLDCDADVQSIKAALIHTFQFDPNPAAGQITVLNTPESTTHDAIISAFKHLVDVTNEGDIVYIHYSGHGDQIRDSSEPSGYDSTIVPCDYQTPSPDNKTEAATNEISGKTILSYINKLRAKKAGQIILSFDSCHSASAARGAAPMAKARGINSEEYLSWYKLHHPNYISSGGAAPFASRGASAQDDLSGSGYVVISACRNTECAYETQTNPRMGRLSYCLAKVLTEATPQTTFREAFDQVYALFHEKFSDQDPQLDGSDPDSDLLGGLAVEPLLSYLVLKDKSGNLSLNAGQFQDMTVGSIFSVFDRSNNDFKSGTEIAKVRIGTVSNEQSSISIVWKKVGLSVESLSGARALEDTHNYTTQPLALDAASVRRELPKQADEILAKLTSNSTGLGMVSAAVRADGYDVACERVLLAGQSEVALVRVSSGSIINVLDLPRDDLTDQIYTALRKESRYRYAAGLGVGQGGLNRSYHLNMKVVASDAAGVPISTSGIAVSDQRVSLSQGTYFIIQVQNRSARPLHVAVLDLESSGDISPIWPPAGTAAQDNIVTPSSQDTWKTLWVNSDTNQPAVFRADTLDSDELLKAIGTIAAQKDGDPDEYVDFGPLATRGASRGPASPFSDLLGAVVDDGVRRAGPVILINPGTWTAATVPFQVVARN